MKVSSTANKLETQRPIFACLATDYTLVIFFLEMYLSYLLRYGGWAKSGLYIVPGRRPAAVNFCFGLVTFQTYKHGWLVRILSNVIVIQLLGKYRKFTYGAGNFYLLPAQLTDWPQKLDTPLSKIGSSNWSSQIPMQLYQKALTGVGAVYQWLTWHFIGHCLQTWTTRFILLHNLTSQEHWNLRDWCFGPNWIGCEYLELLP